MEWYSYMLQRRHKKARIAEAMERRRCHLLKNGLTQWLLVADDLSAMRKQFAVQQQAKVSPACFWIVKKKKNIIYEGKKEFRCFLR